MAKAKRTKKSGSKKSPAKKKALPKRKGPAKRKAAAKTRPAAKKTRPVVKKAKPAKKAAVAKKARPAKKAAPAKPRPTPAPKVPRKQPTHTVVLETPGAAASSTEVEPTGVYRLGALPRRVEPAPSDDTEAHPSEVREIFQTYDRDGSGSIDSAELSRLLEALGQRPSEDELAVALDVVDANRSGKISWTEFSHWWQAR